MDPFGAFDADARHIPTSIAELGASVQPATRADGTVQLAAARQWKS